MQKLISFLNDLESRHIHYCLSKHSSYAIMVEIAVPGERWEVEFCEDGRVFAERFRRHRDMLEGESALIGLLNEYTD